MKILYIAWKGIGSGGANDKIISQINGLNKNGVECIGLFFDANLKSIYQDNENNATYFPVDITKPPKLYSYHFFWRLYLNYEQEEFYKTIEEVIKNMKYDFIFFRYDFADIHFLRFVKKFGKKIFIEYNAIPEREFKKNSVGSPRHTYRYYCEKIFSKSIIRYVKGIIGVTDEITNYQQKRQKRKLGYTLSNGIDVDKYPLKQYVDYNGSVLNMIILTGYTSDKHGIDRILKSMSQYHGEIIINFYIVGMVGENDKLLSKELKLDKQVFFIDFSEKKEIDILFNQIHIGVGSMAFFREGLQEASPLKVRDFLSRGLPFFYGYEDTDLNANIDSNQYFLKFENNNSLIDMQKVVDFFEPILKDKTHIQKIREYALQTVDYQSKIQKFILFLKNIQ